MKKSLIALSVIFGSAVAGGLASEANTLNNLVWSAPEQGDIDFWENHPDIADLVMELDREEDLLHREEFSRKLNVIFKKGTAEPELVCIHTGHEIAGIFNFSFDSRQAEKYMKATPAFNDFFRESYAGYAGKTEYNNRVSTYAQEPCGDEVVRQYAFEVSRVVNAMKQRLGQSEVSPAAPSAP